MIKPNKLISLCHGLFADTQMSSSRTLGQTAITHYPDLKFRFFHIVLHFPSLATEANLALDYTHTAFIAPCKAAKQITYLDLSIPVLPGLTPFQSMY